MISMAMYMYIHVYNEPCDDIIFPPPFGLFSGEKTEAEPMDIEPKLKPSSTTADENGQGIMFI